MPKINQKVIDDFLYALEKIVEADGSCEEKAKAIRVAATHQGREGDLDEFLCWWDLFEAEDLEDQP